MAEVTPDAGTSRLSTASAVDLLLSQSATPETEKVESSEEQQAVDQEVETELLDEQPDDEADEAEVETEESEDEDEEVDYDEAESEDEDDADEVVQAAEQTYRVRVGDEEMDVPLSELTNSYMRQSDYTRKTQQVAEQRKVAEAELEAVLADRQRYADQLVALEQALSQQEPSQEYWDTLYNSDPMEYTRQRDLARDRKDATEQLKAEQARVQQEQVAQMQAAAQKRLAEEQERLPQLIPEWLDQDVAAKEKSAVVTYAQRQGYSQQELEGVSDARAVMMIRKAMLYDELMDKKSVAQKKARQAPKMTKSGQPKSKKQSSQRRKQNALAQISRKKGRASMDAAIDYLLTE
jgi:hypothetical protein